MNAFTLLADALTCHPLPRDEWTEDAMRKAIMLTEIVNPSHGRVDPLRTLRWSDDVIPKLVNWFTLNPSETFK